MGTPYLTIFVPLWRPEIMQTWQTSGFSIATNLISYCERANYSPKHIFFTFTIQRAKHHAIKLFFSICDGPLGRHINFTRSKLGKLERAVFSNGKRYHVENLHRSLFLRDLLLDGDKTWKGLTILKFGFLWRHLKAVTQDTRIPPQQCPGFHTDNPRLAPVQDQRHQQFNFFSHFDSV